MRIEEQFVHLNRALREGNPRCIKVANVTTRHAHIQTLVQKVRDRNATSRGPR